MKESNTTPEQAPNTEPEKQSEKSPENTALLPGVSAEEIRQIVRSELARSRGKSRKKKPSHLDRLLAKTAPKYRIKPEYLKKKTKGEAQS